MITQKTYYEILGVDFNATSLQVVEAYRVRCAEMEHNGDTSDLALLKEAYAVLANRDRRASYDGDLIFGKPEPREKPIPLSTPYYPDVHPNAPTFYEILKIHQTATSLELLEAYRALRKTYEQNGDEPRLNMLEKAYSALSNRNSREKYDAELKRLGLYESPFEGLAGDYPHEHGQLSLGDLMASESPVRKSKPIYSTSPSATKSYQIQKNGLFYPLEQIAGRIDYWVDQIEWSRIPWRHIPTFIFVFIVVFIGAVSLLSLVFDLTPRPPRVVQLAQDATPRAEMRFQPSPVGQNPMFIVADEEAEGDRYLAQENLMWAIYFYERALRSAPSAELFYKLAYTHFTFNQNVGSDDMRFVIYRLEQALLLDPDHMQAQDLLRRAENIRG